MDEGAVDAGEGILAGWKGRIDSPSNKGSK